MRVIVAGGRHLPIRGPEAEKLISEVTRLLKELKASRVVSGCQRGGDTIGEIAALRLRLPIDKFPPDWSQGLKGGPLRNAKMAENADALIVMRGNRGTFDMIQKAQRAGLRIEAIL